MATNCRPDGIVVGLDSLMRADSAPPAQDQALSEPHPSCGGLVRLPTWSERPTVLAVQERGPTRATTPVDPSPSAPKRVVPNPEDYAS